MRPPRAAVLAAGLGVAAAAVLPAEDRTIFIELDARSGALPNAVNASGTMVGKFDDVGSFRARTYNLRLRSAAHSPFMTQCVTTGRVQNVT
jgi:hypothetical protein